MTRVRIAAWVLVAIAGAAIAAPSCSAAPGVGATQTSVSGSSSSGAMGGGGSSGVGFGGMVTSSTGTTGTTSTASLTTGTTGTSTGTGGNPANSHCDASSSDWQDCPCNMAGAMRACYPSTAAPSTRDVGTCKDGMQTCTGGTEVASWGPCTGAVTPTAENCTDGKDHNCNGKIGCMDPSCAMNPACTGACQNGQTRSCYTGPAGTENVGTCKDGTQTCVNGQWQTGCPGEVLPTQEVCSDFKDHNCNGLPGCFDIFACFNDPACQPPPCMPMNGCTCPMGTGDAATCPDGDYGDPVTGLCCPCSASTCDQLGCCGEPECTNVGDCSQLMCGSLDPSCNGLVNSDCDWEDLATSDANNPPEDCDQTCCKCKPTICP